MSPESPETLKPYSHTDRTNKRFGRHVVKIIDVPRYGKVMDMNDIDAVIEANFRLGLGTPKVPRNDT